MVGDNQCEKGFRARTADAYNILTITVGGTRHDNAEYICAEWQDDHGRPAPVFLQGALKPASS